MYRHQAVQLQLAVLQVLPALAVQWLVLWQALLPLGPVLGCWQQAWEAIQVLQVCCLDSTCRQQSVLQA